MKENKNYTLERVTWETLPKLLPLYKSVFKQNLPLAFVQGKFKCNANGKDTLAFIAVANDGTVAAYYNVLPYVISYKQKEMLAVQSCVAMTHDEHRGKGLFPLLGKAVHDLARDEGAKFIFGFTNPLSYHGLVNKMGFTHTDTMKSFKFKVPTLPIGKLLKNLA
ncbi:MAG: GNAT family N-acetyltransferase [Bacteroidetes bacterium]|nr:GNAT family N-acetyltransferase [Bacteroidota bacterium]